MVGASICLCVPVTVVEEEGVASFVVFITNFEHFRQGFGLGQLAKPEPDTPVNRCVCARRYEKESQIHIVNISYGVR